MIRNKNKILLYTNNSENQEHLCFSNPSIAYSLINKYKLKHINFKEVL